MQRIPIFLFVLFFPIAGLNAQQNLLCDKLLYHNTSGENGTSYFEYDGNAKLIKARWQLNDTSRWSANYYIYNEQGQLVEKYREFSDSLTSSVKYFYDDKANVMSEEFTRSDGIHGTSFFIYSEKEILQKIRCNKYNGWFDGEIVITNWENTYPVSANIFQNLKSIGTIQYTYDKNFNLIREIWETESGWNQTFTWIFKPARTIYTSSNVFISENNRFRLIKENYSFNGEASGPSYFTYAESGELTEKVFVRSDSLKTKTSFEYDKNGLLKKSIRHYSDGKTGVFTYEFNNNRKLVLRLFERSDGIKGSEKYSYNSMGQLIKAEWENFDNWLTGTIIFEYGRTGQILKGNFDGEEFDADLIFSYDIYGNLSKIHWSFTFGKTQTYCFEYTRNE